MPATPNTSRYIRALMTDLLDHGRCEVLVTDRLSESAARTRITNAASRAQVKVTTAKVTQTDGTVTIQGLVSDPSPKVHVDGDFGRYSCRAFTLDLMIARHLPTSLGALREVVEERAGHEISTSTEVSTMLVMLGEWHDADLALQQIAEVAR